VNEETRFFVSGYRALFENTDGRIADWFATELRFNSREDAFAYMMDYHTRASKQGWTPIWSFREVRTRLHSSFTFDDIPVKIVTQRRT
jgi:hypothetical protein